MTGHDRLTRALLWSLLILSWLFIVAAALGIIRAITGGTS